MGLSREEMIALGGSIPTEVLTEWSGAMHSLAGKQAARLIKRGVTPAFLGEIAKFNAEVPKLETAQEKGKKEGPAATDDVERLRDEAFDWWREARESAKVEFGTDPDALAPFRTGVHVGGSATKLAREIRFLVPVLRGHIPQLGWLGVNEEFVKRGEALAVKLDVSNVSQEALLKGLPPKTAELYLSKGQLYDLTRKLIRIARIEFRKEPELAGAFSYEIVRRRMAALRGARTRAAAPAAPAAKPSAPAAKPAK